MALQGTLDTFALPDVLRLLASTRKVGRLRVSGEDGSGSLWLDAGEIVGHELLVRGVNGLTAVEVLFNLLRFPQGSFTFDAGSVPSVTGEPRGVESSLGEAEQMLAEWRSLEVFVPSLAARLSLAPELRAREVVLDAARWRIIATIGAGTTVGDVGRRVGLGDLAVMRAVKDVIELGLVDVDAIGAPAEPAASPSTPSAAVTGAAPAGVTPTSPVAPVVDLDAVREPFESPQPDVAFGFDAAPFAMSTAVFADDAPVDLPDEFGLAEVPSFVKEVPLAPPSTTEMRSGLGALRTSDEGRRPVGAEPLAGDSAEIARQLANLSPRAAKAVAAAAKATTEEEREAALAAIEAEDETINRGLLLKFLGSVDG